MYDKFDCLDYVVAQMGLNINYSAIDYMLETMEMINLVYYLLLMLKYYLSKIVPIPPPLTPPPRDNPAAGRLGARPGAWCEWPETGTGAQSPSPPARRDPRRRIDAAEW